MSSSEGMWKFCRNMSKDGLVLLFKKTSENSYKENPFFKNIYLNRTDIKLEGEIQAASFLSQGHPDGLSF